MDQHRCHQGAFHPFHVVLIHERVFKTDVKSLADKANPKYIAYRPIDVYSLQTTATLFDGTLNPNK